MTAGAQPKAPIYRRFYPRISARITLPFLLTVLLIAAFGVFIVTRLVAGSIQERLNNQLLDSAQAASNAMVEIETQTLATLRLIAFTEGMPAAIIGTETETLNTLMQPIAANAGVDDLIIFDSTGNNIYQIQRAFLGDRIAYVYPTQPLDVRVWPGVIEITTSTVDQLGDKYVDVVTQEGGSLLYISAPIINTDSNGELIGGVSIGLSTASLTHRISNQALSEVVLFTGAGDVMGSTFRGVEPQTLALLPEQISVLAGQMQNSLSPVEQMDVRDTTYQVLYAPLQIRSEPVGVMAVALPTDFVAERIGVSRDWFTLLFSALFVGVAVLGLVVTRSIVRPINRMVDTTRAIRTGDLSRRVDLRIPDELGELGQSFDHMTDQLVQQNEEIRGLYVAQLEETTRRDAILTSISDAVIVLDPGGQMLLVNREAELLMSALRPKRDIYRIFVNLCRNAADLAEARQVTLADYVFNVMASPVNMPSGELLGHVIVFHDITTLIEVERVKDEMILQLSHELRTPLTAARGYVEMVQMVSGSQLNEQSTGFMKNALQHMGTLEGMVNQVIDVSAIVSNKFTIDLEEEFLDQIIQQAMDMVRPAMVDREIRLLSRLLPSVEQEITCDGDRLQHALGHVLRNACNYTLPGGWVEVRGSVEGGLATLQVSDSGVGIAPDEIDRVFDRMYRGRSADAGPTDARGLGMGLYITKEVVEAHHGTITLESEPDVGTTVTIVLPVEQGF